MINVLEFDMTHEYKHAWNVSARTCFHIFETLDRCMILYRYKLSNGFIWRKFGISNPSKIKFDKLDGDSLFIFHLDVYKESTVELNDLLDYCLEKKIDVYIPLINEDSKRSLGYDNSHIILIRDILDRYETNRYDFKKITYNKTSEIESSIIEATKPLIRDIKMRKLFN
jgi:hypothetical protein